MSFKEKIKVLREASGNNRLVIFVGAGVSNNSGIPSWHELIKCFAEKINYNKCKTCNFRSSNCPPDCEEKYNFCQDDYLKIPQYFYNKNKANYFKTIREVFNVDAEPNLINKMIMDLQPKHIITTNFDKLIENTDSSNTMIYKVITKDRDLLTYKSNNSYIIKMHGDISEPEEIVLMESDYLNYSQKHILIETFIKSLLVDHIFLFIGYSLNDYNLKLIISWLEYLARSCKKVKRQKNYILIERREKHIDSYFLRNNIITISFSEIPNSMKKRYSNVMPKDMGRNICALLKCILETGSDYLLAPLLDVLYERYQIFKNRKKISFEELNHFHSFGTVERIGQELRLYDQSEFNSLKKILTDSSEKADFIKTILIRAGIETISHQEDSIKVKSLNGIDKYRKLLELEQQNRYEDVLAQVEIMDDEMVKSYYLYLTDPSTGRFTQSIEKVEKDLLISSDYFALIVFKFNKYCLNKLLTWKSEGFQEVEKILKNIPVRNRYSYSYFEKIFEGNYANIIRIKELAGKFMKIYTDMNTICYGEIKYDELLKLQAISYDYYYYFKINNLMIDHFSDPKNILESYVKAMLCTYFPQEEKTSIFFGMKSITPKKYFLNSTDLDILIKYTDLEKLKSFFQDFKVKELGFAEDVRVTGSFINLCNSIIKFPRKFLVLYLKNYLFLLTECSTEYVDINAAGIALSNLLAKEILIGKNILSRIFDELRSFLKAYREIINGDLMVKILQNFLKRDFIDYCKKNQLYLREVFKLLSKYSTNRTNVIISKLIKENKGVKEKIEIIYLLYPLFSKRQKNHYLSFLKGNIKSVPINHLYEYISKDYLKYEKEMEERYLQFLEEEVKKRKKKPGVRTIPDHLLTTIDDLIILFLLKKIRSLKKFECFSGYSEHLSFLLDPEGYDFSRFQSLDYMWENFLRNKKYRKIIVKNGSEIKKNLEKAVQNDRATESQKAILYGYFLSEEETYKYI